MRPTAQTCHKVAPSARAGWVCAMDDLRLLVLRRLVRGRASAIRAAGMGRARGRGRARRRPPLMAYNLGVRRRDVRRGGACAGASRRCRAAVRGCATVACSSPSARTTERDEGVVARSRRERSCMALEKMLDQAARARDCRPPSPARRLPATPAQQARWLALSARVRRARCAVREVPFWPVAEALLAPRTWLRRGRRRRRRAPGRRRYDLLRARCSPAGCSHRLQAAPRSSHRRVSSSAAHSPRSRRSRSRRPSGANAAATSSASCASRPRGDQRGTRRAGGRAERATSRAAAGAAGSRRPSAPRGTGSLRRSKRATSSATPLTRAFVDASPRPPAGRSRRRRPGPKPSLAAAIASTPEPQPRSANGPRRPVVGSASSSSRHSRVVGCAPVPNACAGIDHQLERPAPVGSSHGGRTCSRSPITSGVWKLLPALGPVVGDLASS